MIVMLENSEFVNNFILSIKKEIKEADKLEKIKNIYLKQQDLLRKECESKINELINEINSLKQKNQELDKIIEDLEYKSIETIYVKSRIENLLPLITKLNKISDVVKEMISKMFIILVEEQLQTVIKLADSHAQKNEFTQIEKENLIDSFENLIHSDKLLKKAIKIAYRSEKEKK